MYNDKKIITRIARATKMLLLSVAVAMTCSCDDFLTIYPTDKIVLEDFWKSKEDVENVVAESYRLMTQWDFTSRLLVWGELRADNVIEGNNTGTDIKNILEANLLPTNEYASWAPFYKVINNCNIVMKYAPGVCDEDPSFMQGDLDVVIGQMKALRALCHFYLVRTFRDVPLLVEAIIDDSQNLYQTQADPVEVLDYCLKDLYEAEDLVLTSGNYQNLQDNKGRITKDAVRAMIADVCLWKAAFLSEKSEADESDIRVNECYTECIKYCDLVLDTRKAYMDKYLSDHPSNSIVIHEKYPLVYTSSLDNGLEFPANTSRFPHVPYSALFGGGLSANGGNGCNDPYESIFEIQHGTVESTGNYEIPYFYGGVPGDDLKTFTEGVLSASTHVAVEGKLYNRTDYRRINYVNSSSAGEDEVIDKYGIIKFGHSSVSENHQGVSNYEFGKVAYTFLGNNTSGGKKYFSGRQVNWVVYRISDVMLMKAEALVLRKAGQYLEEARDLVKAVYDRSQTAYDANYLELGTAEAKDLFSSKFAFEEANAFRLVLDERQRELAFEGKRWYDLVRMAVRQGETDEMLAILVPNKYAANQGEYMRKLASINSLFFPIAEREINIHPGLVQNEAYITEDKYEKN